MKPRTPIPKLSKKRRAALGDRRIYSTVRKKPRSKSETLRIYGPPERRAWMKTLPCSACGVVGYSEGAHVLGNGGMSRKADYDTQAPLCGAHPDPRVAPWPRVMGCHQFYDEHRSKFDKTFPNYDPVKAAAETQAAWISFTDRKNGSS